MRCLLFSCAFHSCMYVFGVIREQIIIIGCRMMWCWFRVQFLHGLQRMAKPQYKINNKHLSALQTAELQQKHILCLFCCFLLAQCNYRWIQRKSIFGTARIHLRGIAHFYSLSNWFVAVMDLLFHIRNAYLSFKHLMCYILTPCTDLNRRLDTFNVKSVSHSLTDSKRTRFCLFVSLNYN